MAQLRTGQHASWLSFGMARSVPEIETIILGVRADNHRAIALYRKHGFVQSGCAKDYLKMPSGNYVDEITMEGLLDPEPSRIQKSEKVRRAQNAVHSTIDHALKH
jgi:hypothetical protein